MHIMYMYVFKELFGTVILSLLLHVFIFTYLLYTCCILVLYFISSAIDN